MCRDRGDGGKRMSDTWVYKPHGLHGQPFNSSRCKASVSFDSRMVGFHQCQRKPWKDGWCKQHHPDSVKKRREEQQQRWKQKQENTPARRVARRAEVMEKNYEELRERYNRLIVALNSGLRGNGAAMETVRGIVDEGTVERRVG